MRILTPEHLKNIRPRNVWREELEFAASVLGGFILGAALLGAFLWIESLGRGIQ